MQRKDDRGRMTEEDGKSLRFSLPAIRYPRSATRYGMTLIELMVVTSIILLVIVMSVPIVKPLLASRKQADAARTLSLYLNAARMRAIEDGTSCGVSFERYTDNNQAGGSIFPNNDACILVRQVKQPKDYPGMSTVTSSRVNVLNGEDEISLGTPYISGNTRISRHIKIKTLQFTTPGEPRHWNHSVQEGGSIRFNGQGPYYEIYYDPTTNPKKIMNSDGTGVKIIISKIFRTTVTNGGVVNTADDKEDFPIRDIINNATFAVKRAPRPTLAAPLAFPTGIVVDLEYSGVSDGFLTMDLNIPPQASMLRGSDFQPTGPGDNNAVTIMFAPNGAVDRYYCGAPGTLVERNPRPSEIYYSNSYDGKIPEGPIHLLIGRWERTGGDWQQIGGDWYHLDTYLPDDGLRNYKDMSNYWVTINPRSGLVSISEVAPWDSDLREIASNPLPSPLSTTNSRRWTKTPQVNLGEPVR